MSPAELARLYDAHAASLYAHLHTLLSDDADLLDVLQEVFRKLAEKADLLAGVRDERAYLLRLAHYSGIDHVRRRATRQRAYDRFEVEAEINPGKGRLNPRPIPTKRSFGVNWPPPWKNCPRSNVSLCS